ncbi:epimerase, partial [Staphylococcus arlettae]
PFMREITEMMYITKDGFILNNQKYKDRVGPIIKTDFEQALKETLSQNGKNKV